jgi:hypothetical protein
MERQIANLVGIYKSEGLTKTVMFIFNKVQKRLMKRMKRNDQTYIFSEIYKNNLWNSDESRSGEGSELAQTQNLIRSLPDVFEKFQIKSFIDAPCGDFNWMKHVPLKADIHYTGLDIVPDLIKDTQAKYGNDQYRFAVADITKDRLPKADLLFCRDCLFHLSYKDISSFFKNFLESEIPYLLTTTHYNKDQFINSDIRTGSFRSIDLFSAPFNLPKNVLYRIEDFTPPAREREMCLWDRKQIQDALKQF